MYNFAVGNTEKEKFLRKDIFVLYNNLRKCLVLYIELVNGKKIGFYLFL